MIKKREMRIVVIGPYYPYRGGISDTNQELCETLKKLGHSVEVISFKLQYPSLLFPGKTQYYNKESNQKIKSKRIINSINPFNWINTSRSINDLNPELVISSYWTSFLAPCLFFINRGINKKIQKIGLIHNTYPHEKNFLQKDLFKLYLRSIDKYVTLSKNVFDQIKKITKFKKGISLFHPVPKKFGKPIKKEIALKQIGLKKGYKYLLFFGLIRKYKGLEILIQSMNEIIKEKKDIKLLIVGENYESTEKYKKMISQNNLNNNISLINKFIPEDEIKYWFSSSELIIQPYKKASQSGVTPLAFKFEIPTVCTNIGGLSEYISNKKDGFLCEPNSKDLAKNILLALNSDLNLIKKEIKNKKEKLTWDQFISKLLK
jgi:glycosyltransferase involved in cell wall biosynthesis